MKIAREKLIKFYDEDVREEGRGSHVSSITSLWGEDLILGILQSYWQKEENATSEILSYLCNTGSKSGYRLDAWILKTSASKKLTLYQVEVKNWSAYSIGGEHLPITASDADLRNRSQEYWNYYFGSTSIPDKNVSKVMLPMKKPPGYEAHPVVPLLCFWFLIADEKRTHFSMKRYADGSRVHVFSASSYLRSLKDSHIDIFMPRAERRLRLLFELVSLDHFRTPSVSSGKSSGQSSSPHT